MATYNCQRGSIGSSHGEKTAIQNSDPFNQHEKYMDNTMQLSSYHLLRAQVML